MNSPLILIIAHKRFLTENEKRSFSQCYKILKKYPIKLICPIGLNIDEYKKINSEVQAEFIDPQWMSSYLMFNRLKIDALLYKKFGKFEYILFYELDAWVFRDELEYWCNKGYDYVGAPWTGIHSYNNIPLLGVGNGGFSLRKVKSYIRVLHEMRMLEVLEKYDNLNWKGLLPRLIGIIYSLYKAKKNQGTIERNYDWQEDVFWCKVAPEKLNGLRLQSFALKFISSILIKNEFKIAPVQEALKFSFEGKPAEMFVMNNQTLPFGCHAWQKYEPEFWELYL